MLKRWLPSVMRSMHRTGVPVLIEVAAVSGTSKNAEAAAVSLPSQLRRKTAVDRDRWVWRTPLEKTASPSGPSPACFAAQTVHPVYELHVSMLSPGCVRLQRRMFVLPFPNM